VLECGGGWGGAAHWSAVGPSHGLSVTLRQCVQSWVRSVLHNSTLHTTTTSLLPLSPRQHTTHSCTSNTHATNMQISGEITRRHSQLCPSQRPPAAANGRVRAAAKQAAPGATQAELKKELFTTVTRCALRC
jgi:hypothetical protein